MMAGSDRTVPTFAEVEVGQALPGKTVHIERATLVQYAGASLDRNPIHWDERFATKVALPDVIAHGMFTMGSAVTVVSEWAGDAGRVAARRRGSVRCSVCGCFEAVGRRADAVRGLRHRRSITRIVRERRVL